MKLLRKPFKGSFSGTSGGAGSFSGSFRKGGKPKDSVCWRFNKGVCDVENCRFPHKCGKCFSTSHGAHDCPKGKRKPQQDAEKTKE